METKKNKIININNKILIHKNPFSTTNKILWRLYSVLFQAPLKI